MYLRRRCRLNLSAPPSPKFDIGFKLLFPAVRRKQINMCDAPIAAKEECSSNEIDQEKRPAFGNRFLTNQDDVFAHNACVVRNCSQDKPTTDWEFTRHRKKPVGGGRELKSVADIYRFNAWDNVEWDDEQEEHALQAVQKNSSVKMGEDDKLKFKSQADKFWDTFYGIHQNRFFKDRHWLFTEFSELAPNKDIQEPRSIFELGCGVGNTILPILKYSTEPQLKVYGCDFSAKAIDIFRAHPEFDSKRCEIFVMDATLDEWTVPFDPNSQDIIVLIFVLSAIEPSKMKRVAENCYRYLKPGGFLLFRDYGRYDLAQLRFKSGKCLENNLYVRGDGTMVYFFTQEEVKSLFVAVGFEEEQNVMDRRLQVNRGRMVKMYRVWIQTKYRKPVVKT